MRVLLPVLLALAGCAGLERPSDLAPETHLMLAGIGSYPIGSGPSPAGGAADADSDPYDEEQPIEEPGVVYDDTRPGAYSEPEPASVYAGDGGPPARSVGAKLRALEGKTRLYDRPVDDVALLKAAFEGQSGVGPIDDLVSLRDRTVARREGGIKEGDLLFFGGDRDVPAVAVVHKRVGRGTIEAAAVTRGAIRFIRITPMYPHSRRLKSAGIANSYLRAVRPGDRKGEAYLAGQLLEDVRVLVR